MYRDLFHVRFIFKESNVFYKKIEGIVEQRTQHNLFRQRQHRQFLDLQKVIPFH